MTSLPPPTSSIIEWGWAGRGLELESGDAHVVTPFPGGALVALVDGLGHGPEAAAAANAAVSVLSANAGDLLVPLVLRCHDALRKTRGAVMSVAAFRTVDSSMTWIGVGNVDGVLLRVRPDAQQANEAINVRGGVVGYQLPTLREETLAVSPGDTLVMTTDGIRGGFSGDISIEHHPQEIAESIMVRLAKGTDDAHVVVARYLGGGT